MPASKSTEPDNAPATNDDATAKAKATTAQADPEPVHADVPEGRLPAGVYEFTGPIATQYLEVPLTAHPAYPEQAATADEPAAPATAPTVFNWPFTAPDDGRWQPTKKKPNQQPDNAPALPEE